MLRRLHPHQPDSFAFTPANQAWAEAQMTRFPEGRQASAIIPVMWRAQEQEGWLTRPAIEHIADMLGIAYIRALEVATFYFMFHLAPVGSVAHVQVCGTTPCMLCGAEKLVELCETRINKRAHALSADGRFSWEEVECLGACSNAPMAQIGKDYYEDLTAERLGWILDEFAAGRVPPPGPQTGRYASEPGGGLTSLTGHYDDRMAQNGSVARALDLGDTVKRIDGAETPLSTPWLDKPRDAEGASLPGPKPGAGIPADDTGVTVQEAPAKTMAKPLPSPPPETPTKPIPSATLAPLATEPGTKPAMLQAARDSGADDLQRINGIGPKLEAMLNTMGVHHLDQIADWGAAEVAWIDANLAGFKGRATRDAWVTQAKALVDGDGTQPETFGASRDKVDGE